MLMSLLNMSPSANSLCLVSPARGSRNAVGEEERGCSPNGRTWKAQATRTVCSQKFQLEVSSTLSLERFLLLGPGWKPMSALNWGTKDPPAWVCPKAIWTLLDARCVPFHSCGWLSFPWWKPHYPRPLAIDGFEALWWSGHLNAYRCVKCFEV